MTFLERAFDRARARRARVVFPEIAEPRVAAACDRLRGEGLAEPVGLIPTTDAMIATLVESRGMKESLARRMLDRPLYRAAAMVATGEAEAMVAGADAPTRRVIEAASIAIGLADGVSLPSSCFAMLMPDGRTLVFADCAVNLAPDAEGLAAIARASERTAQSLLGEARVALTREGRSAEVRDGRFQHF